MRFHRNKEYILFEIFVLFKRSCARINHQFPPPGRKRLKLAITCCFSIGQLYDFRIEDYVLPQNMDLICMIFNNYFLNEKGVKFL